MEKINSRTRPASEMYSLLSTVERITVASGIERHSLLGDPYRDDSISHYPIGEKNTSWDKDLQRFLEYPFDEFENSFFNQVARPMMRSHKEYRKGYYATAFEAIKECSAQDWRNLWSFAG